MILTTSLCANYLPKARVLAQTFKQHNLKARTCFCLVEKNLPAGLPETREVDQWLLAQDLGWDNFGRFISSHNRMEGATAVKAKLLQYLFRHYPKEKNILYLDPDVMVWSDFKELEQLLASQAIVLTPHLVVPGNQEMEISCLNHGTYNLGFLALRRSPEAGRFLAWWGKWLDRACYDEQPKGIFTDQKWVDLAPTLFAAHILRDPGYNVATWNLKGRLLTQRGQRLYANHRPVRFLHFSGFDMNTYFWAVERWAGKSKSLAMELGKRYQAALAANGQQKFGALPWSYDALDNGQPLPDHVRRALKNPEVLADQDPYALSLGQISRGLPASERFPGRLWRLLKQIIRRSRQIMAGGN